MNSNNGSGLVVRTADAVATQETRTAFEPRSFEDAMRLAEIVVKSGMFGVTNAADAFVRMSTGVALGLSAVQSLRGIYAIKGKAGISSDLMMALARQSPDCEYFRMVESTPTVATFTAKRRSDTKPTTLSFTIEDAQRAELTGNAMYRRYPAAMLRARCVAALARLMFPEKLHGLYAPEEFADAGAMLDVETVDAQPSVPTPPPSEPKQAPAPPPSQPTQADIDADVRADDARRLFEAAKTQADIEAASAIARTLDKPRKARLVPFRDAAVERLVKAEAESAA